MSSEVGKRAAAACLLQQAPDPVLAPVSNPTPKLGPVGRRREYQWSSQASDPGDVSS